MPVFSLEPTDIVFKGVGFLFFHHRVVGKARPFPLRVFVVVAASAAARQLRMDLEEREGSVASSPPTCHVPPRCRWPLPPPSSHPYLHGRVGRAEPVASRTPTVGRGHRLRPPRRWLPPPSPRSAPLAVAAASALRAVVRE